MNIVSNAFLRSSIPQVFGNRKVAFPAVNRVDFDVNAGGSGYGPGSDKRRIAIPDRQRTADDLAAEIAELQDAERWDGLA